MDFRKRLNALRQVDTVVEVVVASADGFSQRHDVDS